jgi:multiple sugar transport system ATP-binding protein
VYDNLGFALKMRGTAKNEIDRRVRDTAAQLGLTSYLERKPKALSGGQRQRVALGRAMVRQPKVFLFDEPLSNLDARMRVSTRAELSRLHAELKATMIYVTHDQIEAMTMGDRICVMRDGRIQQVATPLEIYQRPANLFVAGFIGTPPMNLLRGQFSTTGTDAFCHLQGAKESFRLPLTAAFADAGRVRDGSAVMVGIRPEHLGVSTATQALAGDAPVAEVVHLETLGADTHVHLALAGQTLIARVPGSQLFARGSKLALQLPPEHCHYFDPVTELSLRGPAA